MFSNYPLTRSDSKWRIVFMRQMAGMSFAGERTPLEASPGYQNPMPGKRLVEIQERKNVAAILRRPVKQNMDSFYDGRIFQIQKAGGVNRYFADLIAGLPPDWRPTLLYPHDL